MNTKISVRLICQIGMLIALAYVLERLFPIINAPTMRITLAFIPMMICGMFFGPIWGAFAYGIADILGWPIMGLVPIPLILISRILTGFLFGLILHRDDIKFWPHAVTSALTTQIICGAGIATFGLSLFTGTPFMPLLWSRVPQHIILIALQLAVFPVLLKLRDALRKNGFVSA